MQIVIEWNRRTVLGLAAVLGLAGAVQWALRPSGAADASQVGTLTTFTAATTISSSEVNANFAALRTAINDNDTRIATLESDLAAAETRIQDLEALLAAVSFDATSDTLIFTGVNVQIRNGLTGAGATNAKDGTGNLILGHNAGTSLDRGGSHNMVIGDDVQYAATASLAVGNGHDIDGDGSAVIGGSQNRVGAANGVIVGGRNNTVSGGLHSVMVGGRLNGIEDGEQGVVVGGQNGTIAEDPAEPNTDGILTVFLGINFSSPISTGGNHKTEIGSGDNVTGVGIGNFMASGASLDMALAADRVLIGDPTDPVRIIEMVGSQQLLLNTTGGFVDLASFTGNVQIRAPGGDITLTDEDGGAEVP